MHSAEQKHFVLKEVPKAHLQSILKLYHDLPRSPFLRMIEDIVQEHSLLVYSYRTTNLLELRTQPGVSLKTKKRILRDSLKAIAALHRCDFVHTGTD